MRYLPLWLVPCLAVGACATTPGADLAGDAPSEQQRSAILFVERQTDGAEATAHVGARFVQYAGLAEEALPDLLGTPTPPSATAGCVERTDPVVDTAAGRAEARLLDVGTLEVHAGTQVVYMEPQRFPDLWNVVSGVIYAADGNLPSDVWRFTAPGSEQPRVGAIDVEARAPDDLAGVTLAEQTLAPDTTVTLPRRGFAVHWTRGDAADSVLVTFEGPGGTERPSAIGCTARDEGRLDVDPVWAERIATVARAGASVTVHRVRTHGFATAQMDNARVVFDFSVRGSVRAE